MGIYRWLPQNGISSICLGNERLYTQIMHGSQTESNTSKLSARQKECLSLVGEGYTSKEIARQLSISPSTVDNHVNSAISLTGAANRAEAARMLRYKTHRQPLPRQPQTLLNPQEIDINDGANRETMSSISLSHFLKLPPFKGRVDNVSWGVRTFQILQIAVLGSIGVLAVALIMAGAIRILS